jgi:Na(+)-translocating NADH:ubiquinone oxidoreductase C subunit
MGIQSINGISMVELYTECMSYLGGITSFKNAACEDKLPLYLFFTEQISAPYSIELNASDKKLETAGLGIAEFLQFINQGNISENYAFEIIEESSTEILPYWKVENTDQIILIMSGNGLWDQIGGYVLLNQKSKIIENIVFSHKSETPGLGAEISTRRFEERFIGLKLGQSHTFLIKKVKEKVELENIHEIQGVSGATITSDGVNQMLNKMLENYSALLE